MPRRIQRQRTKGWRMPEGAVYVGRPSKWGNPFRLQSAVHWGFAGSVEAARVVSADAFRSWIHGSDAWWMGDEARDARQTMLDALPELRGRDLACWCPLDQPCHADVLLELVA
jgi:hypothetical protein